jgi:hypothetical protein
MKNTMSIAELLEWVSYDKDTGLFRWKKVAHPRYFVGDIAGGSAREYTKLTVNNFQIMAHRAAYEICHGPIPIGKDIDHVNGNGKDNRIENLRIASRSENNQNRRVARKDSKTGIIGVGQHKRSKLFFARIVGPDGKKRSLGYFKTPEEAGTAYLKCKREIHSFNTL